MIGFGGIRSGVVVFALAAAAVGACSGSDGDADTASPTVETSVEAPTAATTPTAPPTTAADTTSLPTTSPPTTAGPTTTTEPAPSTTTLDDLRAEIEADLNEGEQALLEAAAEPESVETRAALKSFFRGDSLVSVENLMNTLIDSGLVGRSNETVQSTNLVIEVLEFDDVSAVVLRCRIDAGVVVRPTPDGTEQIVNDTPVRYTAESAVSRIDGVWVLTGGETLTREEGQTECE